MGKVTIKYSSRTDLQMKVHQLLLTDWKTAWEEIGIEYENKKLYLYARHNDAEEIGYIVIYLSETQAFFRTDEEITKLAVFGTNQDTIRTAIKLWDECNTKQYIGDFLGQKLSTETDTPE